MVVLALALSGCASGAPHRVAGTQTDAEVRVYEVFGMDCPGCHGGLEKLVGRLPGVARATANWEAQRLTITLAPGATLEEDALQDAIRRANFTPGQRLR